MNRLAPTDPAAFPAFTLPNPRVSAWVVETTPADTEAWLAALPLADAAGAAQQLYQALYTLNRMELDVDDRLRMMEMYRGPVSVVSNGLRAHFRQIALPLRPRLKQLADFLRELQMELAYGYKHVLESARHEDDPWDNRAVLLMLARAISSLGDVLLYAYQVYRPVPAGVWHEIHGFYRYAEAHGRHEVSLDEVNAGEPLSVSRAYLQVLMLGLCGPYQLPPGECHMANAFLARWAHKATIVTQVETVDPVGHFLLDFDSDHPAVPFPSDVSLHALPSQRAINAVELARVVHGFMKRLKNGETARQLNLGFECAGSACLEIMKRMLRFWGLAGHRHFTRRVQRRALSLCVGLNAIHFFASGQKPFASVRTTARNAEELAVLPSAADLAAESSETQSQGSASETFRVDTRWHLRDESAGGLALERSGALGPLLRVGDLLGLHQIEQDRWRIGVVRWLKSPDSQRVEMGVEMLAPMAYPVAVKPAAVNDAVFEPGLLLPPIEALHQPSTLLLARATVRAGEAIDILDEDLPARRVRVLNVVERSGAFVQLVFADVAS
jgi:hypothetical protein